MYDDTLKDNLNILWKQSRYVLEFWNSSQGPCLAEPHFSFAQQKTQAF